MSNLMCLEDYKIQASLLLKDARSSAPSRKETAVKRCAVSSEYTPHSPLKLKHTLAVIAHENGFKSWTDLKSYVQNSAEYSFKQFFRNGFLNKWFRNYEEAKAHHHPMDGGYLLPHKYQFFICEESYIQNIGLDPKDPDWKLIGWDWVNPACKKAKNRLLEKWMRSQQSK